MKVVNLFVEKGRFWFMIQFMRTHIVLMTDFGTRDGYAAIMKGVIWSIAPGAEVADLSHEIAPQDVMAGALTLARAAPYFPEGTIFVAVVDPGVGTARRGLAARLGGQYFVAPDNGLLTVALQRTEEAGGSAEVVWLDRPRFWLDRVSATFHGRDIFAPAAAHLANGVALSELGSPITDVVRLWLPAPRRTERGWQGEVIHVDNFGNLATNLGAQHLAAAGSEGVEIKVAGERIVGVVAAYGERTAGELVALIDSSGALSIAVVNGSAAARLRVGVSEPIEIYFSA
jgi:S-adenosyl-L-methionine hydrolase (adenosine-forming)